MKKIAAALLMMILLVSCSYAQPLDTPKFDCASYIVIDMSTQNVILEKDPHKIFPASSFAKIMTAVVALDKISTNHLITVTDESFQGFIPAGNIARIALGESMIMENFLYPMILLSSDEAANTVATGVSSNVETFVRLMNQKAAELGMTSAKFVSPNGYDKNGQSTLSASDLSKLCMHALSNNTFRKIVATDITNIPPAPGESKNRSFSSRNHLISRYTFNKYLYSAAKGILPAYDVVHGSHMATLAKKGDTELLCIVMGAPVKNETYQNHVVSKEILEFVYQSYSPRQVTRENDILHQVKVSGGDAKNILLSASEQKKVLLPKAFDKEKLEIRIDAPNVVKAPVEKNQQIGTAVFLYDGRQICTVSLVADSTVLSKPFGMIGRLIKNIFSDYLLIALIIITIILIAIHNANKRKRIKKRKQTSSRR